MFRVASLVAGLTVLSKVLGLVRDLVIANYFGTSMMADAFNLAYLFTGNFFIIFGTIGGPFYSAIVATLPKLEQNHSTWDFIKDILIKTSFGLSAIALGIYVYKGHLLKFFIDENKIEYFQATLTNIDILLPLIVLCGPIGIIFAILNCYKRYVEPSLAPAVVNIALIAAVFLMGDAANGIALALGTSIGGALSLGFQIPGLMQIRSSHKESGTQPKNDTAIKDYHKILFPALFSTGIAQAMVFIDSFFCKGLEEGSWTSLVLANRLIQLPLGVLLTAFLVPLFPRITELVKELKLDEIKRLLRKSIGILTLMCIPATFVGMYWSEEIIRILFERGAFTANSTAMVSSLFFYLCISIIPYVFKDSFARACYSFGDSRSPFLVMLFGISLKLVLNFLLVERFGLNGIAISTTLVSVVNAAILFMILRAKFR
ncbi:MAG: murein biosynthesis integral membrane protein MurJ [Candidatus Melainabacteria bacterium]|nr:murein biosynthesis integral membrane protein MurJ [Candidatus Melainabacteria bacterium]